MTSHTTWSFSKRRGRSSRAQPGSRGNGSARPRNSTTPVKVRRAWPSLLAAKRSHTTSSNTFHPHLPVPLPLPAEAARLEAWLDKAEAYIAKPDLGSDALQVESLKAEQSDMEAQRDTQRPAVEALVAKGRHFKEGDYVDDNGVVSRVELISGRFADLQEPLAQRGQNLQASFALQKLLVAIKTQGGRHWQRVAMSCSFARPPCRCNAKFNVLHPLPEVPVPISESIPELLFH